MPVETHPLLQVGTTQRFWRDLHCIRCQPRSTAVAVYSYVTPRLTMGTHSHGKRAHRQIKEATEGSCGHLFDGKPRDVKIWVSIKYKICLTENHPTLVGSQTKPTESLTAIRRHLVICDTFFKRKTQIALCRCVFQNCAPQIPNLTPNAPKGDQGRDRNENSKDPFHPKRNK